MAKLSTREMQAIRTARPDIAPGMLFRHYKGGLYEVMLVMLDTDTMKARIAYKRLDGPGFDAEEELGLVYDRRIEEWEEPRMVREKRQPPAVYPRCKGGKFCGHSPNTCSATIER